MTRLLQIGDEASAELTDAVRWYETRRPGLGSEFLDSVVEAISTIGAHPERGAALIDDMTRRLRIVRFPYTLIYRLSGDGIVVLAVAHVKRRPGFWRHRS